MPIQNYLAAAGLAVLMASGNALAGTSTSSIPATIQSGLQSADGAKVMVSARNLDSHKWPDSNADAGFNGYTNNTSTVNIAHDGHITIKFTSPAEIRGKIVTLVPQASKNGEIVWACNAGGISTELLPGQCQ